ncbi:hypothetical protein ACTQ49_06950 [Luteococcus sp. Sow4_B9]|uniref:hypothetical protein n=1 Tax=Luteococcus sp. Sow4_B9 TaxID=3438792 RepID=UPI003F957DB5
MNNTTQRTPLRGIAIGLGLSLALGGLAGCSQDSPGTDASPSASPVASQEASTRASATASAATPDPSAASTDPSAASTDPSAGESARPSSKPSPVATTPVPAPSAASTAPAATAKAPVALDRPVELAPKVDVRITGVKAITAEAKLPGDVSGPAVQFDVVVDNQSDAPVSTANAVVNVLGSDKSPAVMVFSPPSDPLEASVAAGAKATGTYVFRLPAAKRNPVTIEVSVDPALPVANFTGAVK